MPLKPRRDNIGSSPRAWGTRVDDGQGRHRPRFIPTCMGNARIPPRAAVPPAVHPHVHGERYRFMGIADSIIGSSPRAWGTPDIFFDYHFGDRFIPTCMGNAVSKAPRLTVFAVHPHVHGERFVPIASPPAKYGSSPRAWGTLVEPHRTVELYRFIPTCMGNAFRGIPGKSGPTVHPHVHGERILKRCRHMIGVGSSPRAWGTRCLTIYKKA